MKKIVQGRHRKLVQSCIVCGLVFVLIVVGWAQLYRLDFIQNGLTEMETITDDAIRRREFYWLGQIMTVTAVVGAGIFSVVFYMSEEFFLGPRPKNKQQENQNRIPTSIQLILAFVVVTFFGGTKSLWGSIYLLPWVCFLFALGCFIWRLSGRTDYFPLKRD